jgi:GT2 family glycosyltransferase/2-polyprenyl-3-methyl-5-hydroxy-6-metoxy-1,4-benzoquinol methylase
MIEMIAPKSKVLEFGPAHGRMTKYLKENLDCVVDIVEIDEEAGRDASQYADHALLGNIAGDIENYVWLEKFGGNRYDYIIFADVLEHLHNPEDVIAKCKRILKDSGSILISLPNIAHNSILINLYFNKFKYTEYGLLDRTHIRFFAFNELDTLYKNVGFVLTEFHTTEAFAQLTEQAEFFDANYDNIKELFSDRSLGDAYQFILRLQQSETAENKRIDLDDLDIISKKTPVTLYLNSGEGYSEQEKEIQNIDIENPFKVRFEIKQGIFSLRFDPAEGFPCNVRISHVESDAQITTVKPINSTDGYAENELFDEFLNKDPMYEINGDFTEATFIEIEAEVKRIHTADYLVRTNSLIGTVLNDIEVNKRESDLIQEQYHESEERLKNTQNQLQNSQNLLLNTQNQLLDTQDQLQGIQNQLQNSQSLLLNTQNQLFETQKILQDTQAALTQTQASLTATINSTCWKITKPVRATLDCIKLALKSNRYGHLTYKGIKSLSEKGIKATIIKVNNKLKGRSQKRSNQSINESYFLTDEEKLKQRETKFNKNIKFSILTPLYNTPKVFLIEMIDSVLNQTYSNWELCLADGSNAYHSEVSVICKDYARRDKRIQYKKLDKNLGISENTNQCIAMSSGDYLALLDHDDLLHPSALYEAMKVICEENADFIYTDENTFSLTPMDAYCPHFKPDYSPDTLRSYNYICHLSIFSRQLLEKVGCFKSEYDGSQDYDIILRLTEAADCIVHIPKILYYWRSHQNSVAMDVSAKPYVMDAAKRALSDHLQRIGFDGEVTDSSIITTYKINYKINGSPLVSILIPNKDHIDDLRKCLDSILEKSTYKNYEIIIIENNSEQAETFSCYEILKKNPRIKIFEWVGEFNYSAVNNFGVKYASGEYILFLNNDTETITSNWIEEMLMFAQRSDIGAVGAKLFYPDDTIQHAGVILGIGGVGGHSHKYFSRYDTGYMSRLTIVQNLSACTAACMMVPRSIFDEVGGFDESFQIAFNDVDLCMKIREKGYLIVVTPYAELYHFESKSRGYEDTIEKQKRFQNEVLRFQDRWKDTLMKGDPYYNKNLTLDKEDFSLKL